jgi:DNA-binding Lrp family transcriptional regulator
MKISSLQRKVLAQITWEARLTPEEVARRLGIRPHNARYAMRQLAESLRLHPYCFLDPFKQGLIPYRALFSIDSSDLVRCRKLVAFLQTRPEVIWLRGLQGHYQFLMALRVSSTEHLDSFLQEFDSQFGDIIVAKTLAEMSRTCCFIPWLAYSGKGARRCFEYRHGASAIPLEPLDQAILAELKEHPLASISSLARTLGIPASTAAYRFDRLNKLRVIVGFAYSYDHVAAGVQSHVILVKLKGLGGGLHGSFFEFSASHRRISRVTRMVGEWDLEIEVELDNNLELNSVIHQLYKHGKGAIREVLSHGFAETYLG